MKLYSKQELQKFLCVCVCHALFFHDFWQYKAREELVSSSFTVLETSMDLDFLGFDSNKQLLQMCQLHINVVTLLFHHIPKMLRWAEIWGL